MCCEQTWCLLERLSSLRIGSSSRSNCKGLLQDLEDDNMTDEQMFKMDKLLAAVLRTQKEAKDKSKDTKRVSAFSTFLKMQDTHE